MLPCSQSISPDRSRLHKKLIRKEGPGATQVKLILVQRRPGRPAASAKLASPSLKNKSPAHHTHTPFLEGGSRKEALQENFALSGVFRDSPRFGAPPREKIATTRFSSHRRCYGHLPCPPHLPSVPPSWSPLPNPQSPHPCTPKDRPLALSPAGSKRWQSLEPA